MLPCKEKSPETPPVERLSPPQNEKKTEQYPSTNNTQIHLLRESNDRRRFEQSKTKRFADDEGADLDCLAMGACSQIV